MESKLLISYRKQYHDDCRSQNLVGTHTANSRLAFEYFSFIYVIHYMFTNCRGIIDNFAYGFYLQSLGVIGRRFKDRKFFLMFFVFFKICPF